MKSDKYETLSHENHIFQSMRIPEHKQMIGHTLELEWRTGEKGMWST